MLRVPRFLLDPGGAVGRFEAKNLFFACVNNSCRFISKDTGGGRAGPERLLLFFLRFEEEGGGGGLSTVPL